MKFLRKSILILLGMLIATTSVVTVMPKKAYAHGSDWGRAAIIVYGVDQLFNNGQATRAIVNGLGEVVNVPSRIVNDYLYPKPRTTTIYYHYPPQNTYTTTVISAHPRYQENDYCQYYQPLGSTTITIVNATKNLRLNVIVDGKKLASLRPGETTSISKKSFRQEEMSVVCIGRCAKRNVAGVATRIYGIIPGQKFSQVMVVRRKDLK
ncbi:hypothetical protein J7J23_00240 [bacterium]|nr:hypothetical protein [bacterium]